MIDLKDAEHAERFECYCGRPLEAGVAVVCSGCNKAPSDCRCVELEEGAPAT